MLPHPILMDSYWHDRNRLVLAAAMRQQHRQQLDAKSPAVVSREPHLASRILAFLAGIAGRRNSQAAGALV